MDRKLVRDVEFGFPYPIAIEFRRLNTPEYIQADAKRLKQIFKTAEKTAHFLALVAASDALELAERGKASLEEPFRKDFWPRFSRPTFGNWVWMLREFLKATRENGCFVRELATCFIDAKGGEGAAQKAFNELTTARNRIEHPSFTPTPQAFRDLVAKTEGLLESALSELGFLADYRFLYVQSNAVTYYRFMEPRFTHTLAEVTGLTSEFSSFLEEKDKPFHTPSVIVSDQASERYLDLGPFILQSERGAERIPDIFLYAGIDISKKFIRYLPADKGGEFNLCGCPEFAAIAAGIDRALRAFAADKDVAQFARFVEQASHCAGESAGALAEGRE